MPPLTLEQVLTRSMRMSRKRVPKAVSRLFDQPNESAELRHIASQTLFGKPPSTRFDQMVKNEDEEMSHRMSIHASHGLVKNNVDLLAILRSSARIGSWEDAVNAFVKTTGCELTRAISTKTTNISNNREFQVNGSILPTLEHVSVLLNICVKAGQWGMVEKIVKRFAEQFPELLVRVATALGKQKQFTHNTALAELKSEYERCFDTDTWHKQTSMLPLWFIRERCKIPCHCIPVDVYNVCLKLCEAEGDWQGALHIIRSMGANPLQNIDLEEEEEESSPQSHEHKWEQNKEQQKELEEERQNEVNADKKDAEPLNENEHYEQLQEHQKQIDNNEEEVDMKQTDMASSNNSKSVELPSPNVVSYAVLIATLEEAGRNDLARRVLSILPPLERDEITASYAALIYVWANQAAHSHNHNRRGKKF